MDIFHDGSKAESVPVTHAFSPILADATASSGGLSMTTRLDYQQPGNQLAFEISDPGSLIQDYRSLYIS